MAGGQVQQGNTVGSRMRLARKRAGLTLQDVGDLLGVTRQQIAKYEDGISRIAAEQLMMVARCCDVPLTYFYNNDVLPQTPADAIDRQQAARMEQAFAKVADPETRDRLIAIVEDAALADLSILQVPPQAGHG